MQKYKSSHKCLGLRIWALLSILAILAGTALAQITPLGAGSYTKTLPTGNIGPASTIYKSTTGPVPTHKFWTAKYWYPLGDVGANSPYRMYPQPLQAYVTAQGMLIGIHGDIDGWNPNTSQTDQSASDIAIYQYFNGDLTIGTAGLNAANVNISATSDWTADFSWGSQLTVRMGRGMPFAYVLTDGSAPSVTFARTPTVVTNNQNILAVSTPEGDTRYTNYYGLFCPTGGTWNQSGNTFTCVAPAGKNYMSVALLPGDSSALSDYGKYAFSFPTDTRVSWNYDESTSKVSTTYTVTTQAMEGSEAGFLMALYPHQYDALPGGVNTAYTYTSIRGKMKVLAGNSFTTVDTFHGILPFIPPTSNYDLAKLSTYVTSAPTSVLAGDTYAQGKNLGRAAQVLPLAKVVGNTTAYNALHNSIESVLQNWFTASNGEGANLFYYNSNWGSLIGYPAGYGSNETLSDHHFHYGYFIHAAALDGLANPTWISNSNWGGMVDLLRQDISNFDRTNTMFPFLRSFDAYAGHSWASGIAGFGDGGNEESSSEAVNAWAGVILYGSAIGDKSIRDAGIWLYTQETKAAAYYWFNSQPNWVTTNATNTFPSWWPRVAIANLFDAKSDPATWFGANPDYEHAIEYLPFTGGSLYLGLDPNYVQKNFTDDYVANGNRLPDWPDLMEMYEALYDPETAYTRWQSVTSPTDGETLAHEYAWLMSLRELGQVDATVTANTPLYAVFSKGGTKTHVAYNSTSASLNVTFSDGVTLTVPAGTMLSDTGINVQYGPGVATVEPPSAPVGVIATAKSANQIDLSWTAQSNATYNVYRSTQTGVTPATGTLAASGLSSASYSDMNLTAGTQYFYVVVAVNSAGSSDPSAEVSATTTTSGGSTGGSDTLYLVSGATVDTPSTLSFTATAAGNDSVPSNSPQTPDSPQNPLTYTITGLNGTYDSSRNTAFDLFVDAGTNAGEAVQVQVLYDLNGDGTSDRVEQYSYFALNPVVDFEDYSQSSQGGLQVGNTSGSLADMTNGTVTLKVWGALPGPNNQPITLSTGNTPSAISKLVIPFTGVTQSVSAPEKPTALTATAASSSAITLSWSASPSSGVTYSIYRSTTSGFTPADSNRIASAVTALHYSDTGLTAGTTYYYVVAAVNQAGSASSDEANATTLTGGATIVGNTLYVLTGATLATPGTLSFTQGSAASVDTLPANNGATQGTPTQPLVYVAKGISGTYDSSAVTQFKMFVDAQSHVGDGVQMQILYDLNGDGNVDRTEMYSFFATNDIVDWESYGQADRGGLQNATGSLGNMVNGSIQIKIWNALGFDPIDLRTGATADEGNQSALVIPFTSVTQTLPPEAPTHVIASAVSSSEIDLTWTASPTQNVKYDVYRSTVSGFTPATDTLIGNVTTTTFADTSVSALTTYYYVIAAVNGGGSAAADEVSATTPTAIIATTTTLSASANSILKGGSVTLTASVAPTAATGTITFRDGSTVLTTVTLASGQATYTTSDLALGQHVIEADYSGDSNYSASSSTTATVNVGDFAIAAPTTSTATVSAGQSASFTFTLTPQDGFTGNVSFSCSGLPANAACVFNPATVTVGSSAATTTLTITTLGNTTAALAMPSKSGGKMTPLYAAFALQFGCVAMLMICGKKNRARATRVLLGSVAVTALLIASACGGSSQSTPTGPRTPAGTSTITVSATSGSVVHTTSVTLTVR